MSHTCHADNCQKNIAPKLFMCLQHWKMVPKDMQNNVWNNYRQGQENDKRPTIAYLKATRLARCFVAFKEKGYSEEEIRVGLRNMEEKYQKMMGITV